MIYAYLDDIYVICNPERARDIFEMTRIALREDVGINVHLGKCKCWNRAGEEPPHMAELGTDVWVGGEDTPIQNRGIKVLGSPIGSDEFVRQLCRERLDHEQIFLNAIANIPDIQSAWLLLLYCACPRCNHTLRTVSPRLKDLYAQGHGAAIRNTLAATK